MKRLPRVLSVVVLLVPVLILGQTTRRFDVKLTPDKQIVHVLNRLTFGARPGDASEVRRIGVERWIDLQLHPERIPALSECRLCGIYLVVCSALTNRCQGNPHREINGIIVVLGRPLKVGARRIESLR